MKSNFGRKSQFVAYSLLCALSFLSSLGAIAEDVSGPVKRALEQSTLDQEGTPPFHLHATLAASSERDRVSGRTGEVEIWWESPAHWRREVRSPEFHQVEIVDGARDWQKNDGGYYPEWLREIAVAIVKPVPIPLDQLLARVKSAEVRHMPMASQTNVDWAQISGPGDQEVNGPGYIAFYDKGNMLFYTGGAGWGGLYKDFAPFHGKQIARSVSGGSPEVTAKVDLIEDLGVEPAGFFDADAPGADPSPLRTVVLSDKELQNQLVSPPQFSWPPVLDGPFEGVVWSEFVIDRGGHVREMGRPVSDNPGLRDAAEQQFRTLEFRPVIRDGIPVQVVARFSVPFKTARPAGMDDLQSARHYFEQGRKSSYLAYNNGPPYVLRGEFQIATDKGIETGRYEDTWLSSTEWRRDAWLGANHVARARKGNVYYRISEGPDPRIPAFVLMIAEPIPTVDTMTESDWRVRRVSLDGKAAIRVIRGPENPDGSPQSNAQAYWFADDGHLTKSYTNGMEVVPSGAVSFGGLTTARMIGLIEDGHLGMKLMFNDIVPPSPDAAKHIVLKGHEWQRAFTAEER